MFTPLFGIQSLFRRMMLLDIAMLDIALSAMMMALDEVLTEDEDPETPDVDTTASSSMKAAFAAKLAATKEAARNSHSKQQKNQYPKTAKKSGTDQQKQGTTFKAMFLDSMQMMKALNRILVDEQRKKGIPGYFW